MALTRYKLGDLLQFEDERNSDNKYTLDDVKGISIQKIFIETKADMQDVSLTPYILVKPDFFVYVTVTSRNGEKITLAHNTTKDTYIVSSSYVVFSIARKDLLNSDYLFMYFNRPEFDRFSRFNSWGSARETFSWEDFCDIDIDLPPLQIQQKYVDVYNSMLANQKSYERGLEDLKLTCDATIEDFKRKYPCEKISKYIHEENLRNTNEVLKEVLGVCKDKVFIPTIANMEGISLENYKIVKPNWFAYSNRINIGSIALKYDTPCLVSPSYTVFSVDETKMYPEYLSLWLQREEFCHFAFYYSLGTVKDELDMTELGQMNIPFPSLEIQNNIITIYKNYLERKELNEKLKSQIKSICPILIKGSIEEAMREA